MLDTTTPTIPRPILGMKPELVADVDCGTEPELVPAWVSAAELVIVPCPALVVARPLLEPVVVSAVYGLVVEALYMLPVRHRAGGSTTL